MLRRVNGKAQPHYGHLLRWDVLYSLALKRPALWQPCLFDNPVIQLWARYQLEPGRRIDKLFDAVDWKVYTQDGVTEIDEPATGEFGSDIHTPTSRLASARYQGCATKHAAAWICGFGMTVRAAAARTGATGPSAPWPRAGPVTWRRPDSTTTTCGTACTKVIMSFCRSRFRTWLWRLRIEYL
jgi:hypothetical protein